ncbi:DUF3606 domain-containing protein [Sphingomonas sp. MG17]|uniref:DUF3606 domain-containing protein n=1 Tax=Sphingomonas tagetis TaxID=2949092 RepID=A0A9X2HS05_9SPHN|nr:DUF3606 domain-containing protein [Sphingomonas tagetis]MCP3732514.1 DUF3606 domain-containing protein [Sphingomonas tagetis]
MHDASPHAQRCSGSHDKDYEVRNWSERFGVTRPRLEQAVDAVCSSADRIKEYLGRERTA